MIKKIGAPLLIAGLAGCMLLILLYPEASLDAALRGLAVWWDVLFPSLFPFFVLSELMLGFGIVHLFGALLDPLMRPLFRIPGCGGFVMAMGYVSGYPVGARLTAKLREQGQLTRIEGERLVAFTTSSDPIFLLGAVSVGFFHNAALGPYLALSHYGSGLILGLLLSFYGRKEERRWAGADRMRPVEPARPGPIDTDHPGPQTDLAGEQSGAPDKLSLEADVRMSARTRLQTALSSMYEARRRDGRTLGELLKGAVESSLRLIMVVGGLVVFFTMLMELLERAGILSLLLSAAGHVLTVAGFPAGLTEALTSGFFEVTVGVKAAGSAAAALPYKAAAAAFILSWGGLSVHAQVASIWNGTGLRYAPFMVARLIHAVLSALLALVLWRPMMGSAPVLAPLAEGRPVSSIPSGLALLGSMLGVMLLLSLAAAAISRIGRLHKEK
ncbi:sporulation integral membrane protein YlbJ [Paenibacillus sp. HN-1]|uniref:nucleoside recognition domain-containing protein n=1 Tax=Paenibacillus TaxID=44249 RepID=UPI001CA88C1B|nr:MULTISPECIES: nucleoside recognition domain-containing protein [Paenibacillus]MBY9078890.1 sporulation integral membrane protein YlbJ [Paenibacillus sp. CGMCC 1.18879]MBY9082876.1 sporulation integral membrane protein YlbJ [Paenibacillus sinensis]